ncbi:MAG: DUF5667 domain-containing protein [Chloroflexi bacterium]|nr:DUF5667 domain-containing protein [Chloroflexota bacterium]
MPIKIEEAFNDCFERLSAGESLDSCLHDYEEYSAKLDTMLKTTFDIKRRAYPVQPRPEFKYWARVRLQGVQDYVSRQPVQARPSGFNLRRNLAISMAALLVFVIASSGTVAASSDSLPDEPLYGVKLAVEQAQVSLSFSDVDKAELYAHLAEKRAGEIVAMAQQGKTDKMETTTANMNYQLDQAEQFISKYEEANATTTAGEAAATTAPSTTSTAPMKTDITPPDQSAATTVAPGQQGNFTLPPKPLPAATRAATNISRAKNTMNATTAKSLAALQNALANAPDSAKPALLEVIQHTRQANIRALQQLNLDNSQQAPPSGLKPNAMPTVPADKPKYIPPLNNNFKPVDPHPFNKPDLHNALPQGGVNNHTGTTDNSDDDHK